jgi:hypothetical protein
MYYTVRWKSLVEELKSAKKNSYLINHSKNTELTKKDCKAPMSVKYAKIYH